MGKFEHSNLLVSLSEGHRHGYSLAAVAVGLGIGAAGLCKALHSSLVMPWVSWKFFSESERVYYAGGLKNLGNNCFLNVILQALASCDHFVSSLDDLLGSDSVLPEEQPERMPLISGLSSLLKDLSIVRDERTVLNPQRVMHALSFYYTSKGKLSLDFENFHCLPLSPVPDINGDIINGCSLVDCLKHFTVLEHLDNYRCDRCWHNAAAKYISLTSGVDEEKVNKLRSCVDYDNCSCRHIFGQEITWSVSSKATKQLAITHCPQILCIHLLRASISLHGELVKREGHISFPSLLNLSPFAGGTFSTGQGPGPSAMNLRRHGQASFHPYRENVQMPVNMLPTGGESSSQSCKDEVTNGGGYSLYKANVDVASSSLSSSPSRNKLYSLSAVVEHYGVCGGGHYAAYRRVTPNCDANHLVRSLGKQWLYISDDHVSQVSEGDVLGAEATLLFYERL